MHELCCLVYCYVDCRSVHFLAIHCCNFAYCCCNRFWWCFCPKKYTLKFINIQYVGVRRIKTIIYNCNRFHCRIYSQMCELLIGTLTLMNFLKRQFFKSHIVTQYLYSTLTHRPINRCSNIGAAVVHTISRALINSNSSSWCGCRGGKRTFSASYACS